MSKTKGSARLAKAKGIPHRKTLTTTEVVKGTTPKKALAEEETVVRTQTKALSTPGDGSILIEETQDMSPKVTMPLDNKIEVLEIYPQKPQAKVSEKVVEDEESEVDKDRQGK